MPGRSGAFHGRVFFFWAPRNHVVDATTRSDTTCSRRWGETTDLSARLQLLPLRDHRLQSVLLSRPNGQLTRAGQFYHSITGRRPPSRQFDESQPLIRDGPNDYILTRRGARKLVRSLQANGQYHVTKLGKSFFKDKFTEWLAHVPVIIRGRRRNGTPYERHDYLPATALEMGLSR